MLWVERIMPINGTLYMVYCHACSEVDGCDHLFASKWDMLCKYEDRRKAKRDMLWRGLKKGDTFIV
jgi:hypothetical protein